MTSNRLGTSIVRKSVLFLALLASCTYFNTFYNAKQFFRQGKEASEKERDKEKLPSSAIELFDKSIEKSAMVVKKHPRSRYVDDALFLMGRSYYEKRDYIRAREKFEALELFYPNSALRFESQYYRGLCNRGDKNYGMAIVVFGELAEKNSKYQERSRYQIGEVYYEQGEYEKLLGHYAEFLKKFPKSRYRSRIYFLMGEAAVQMKEYRAGLYDYALALKFTEDKVEIKKTKLKIGECYLLIKDYEGGLNYLRREDEAEFRLLKAKFLKTGNQPKEALKSLQELNREHPGGEMGAEIYYETGLLFEEQEILDSAAIYFDSAFVLAPTSTFGEHSLKRRQTINKILEYRAKSEEDPAKAQFLLAELFFVNLSDTNRSLTEYEKVYKNYPHSPLAAKAMYAYAWIRQNLLKQDSLGLDFLSRTYSEIPGH